MSDQEFHPYTAWEDWQAGMWQSPQDVTAEMENAAHILTDAALFLASARAMLQDWPMAAAQNLTAMAQNRRAWVGQATCCHLAGIAETATRAAWWTLTPAEQYTANQVADQAIAEWQAARDHHRNPGLFVITFSGTETEGTQLSA